MADKSSQLILAALSRAAAAAAPLHGSKSVPGLFPNNAVGKQAAQRCQEEGYLRLAEPQDAAAHADGDGGTATMVKKKSTAHPLCAITEKGLAYLLSEVSPRPVLEDFVRVLESRRRQADELLTMARHMQQSIESLKSNAEKVLHHACQPDAAAERGTGGLKSMFAGFRNDTNASSNADKTTASSAVSLDIVLAELNCWHDAESSEDCPLPHLYRQLAARAPSCSIGHFHDALRQLHERGEIYLHPWTGPLYDIPEPPYALLVGHEIAYYASRREINRQ